jgi:hypothetical protein
MPTRDGIESERSSVAGWFSILVGLAACCTVAAATVFRALHGLGRESDGRFVLAIAVALMALIIGGWERTVRITLHMKIRFTNLYRQLTPLVPCEGSPRLWRGAAAAQLSAI